MTGHDYLRLASKLASASADDEAALRSAISRAYYGAFHLAIAYLESLGFQTTGHGEPRYLLSASDNSDTIHAGTLLSDLQNARVRADYKFHDRTITQTVTRRLVESAFEFRDLLNSCSDEATKSAIAARIRVYLEQRGGGR